jgi:membrane associated rhomboid family serine protease
MQEIKNTVFFFIVYCLCGILCFFIIEGAPPKSYHILLGPFLIFKYGAKDAYIGVVGALVLFPFLSAPLYLKNRFAYVLLGFGGIVWLIVAEFIRGIAI